MAALSTAERAEGTAEYVRECANERVAVELTKAQLRAAYDAADTWVDTNSAAFNTAIPLPARTTLTQVQKSRLLMHVIRRRFGLGM